MVNLIPLWPNLARAYEIAKLGMLKIKVVFQPDYVEGLQDYAAIKKFYTGVTFCNDAEITVEITKPESYAPKASARTLEDVFADLARINHIKMPTEFESSACKLFLDNAIKKLHLSLTAHRNIMQVAGVIAILEGCMKIRPEHIAEAVQYNAIDYSGGVVEAEAGYIRFGGISIPITEVVADDVKDAIAYLRETLAQSIT